MDMTEITEQARQALLELLETAKLKPGAVLVVGCSSSEILGEKIGTASSMDAAKAVLEGILPVLEQKQIYLAAQCCEHLNRALIVEWEMAEKYGLEPVNVVPQPKAGGSFATNVYQMFREPVAVEHVRADAGMDIGATLIGMHLKPVAVPVRVSVKQIGSAPLILARTRPKFVGGVRAQYDPELL